ncbi:MAG: cell shape-determining protein MreD, partial [Sulfurimonas sp.]|nr:cell shape-determining protein MreD [Sulfurimonas sp.]
MSVIIGKIASLDGTFYAKGPDGSMRQLSKGDAIFEGEIVIGDGANSSIDSVIVAMNDGTDLVLLGNDTQLFDASLSQEQFAESDTVTDPNSILSMLEENEDLENIDVDDIETAAGEDGAESEGGVPGEFAQFNGAETDVNAQVRGAGFGTGDNNADKELNLFEEARRAEALRDTAATESLAVVDTTAPEYV